MAIADILVGIFVWRDFSKIRKSDGYDNLSIWEKIKFSSVFFFILTALVSLLTFLIYFTIIPIQIL